MSAAFAEHEAKLRQQQEALARQSQKGIATLQVQCPALASAAAHHPPNAVLCSRAMAFQRLSFPTLAAPKYHFEYLVDLNRSGRSMCSLDLHAACWQLAAQCCKTVLSHATDNLEHCFAYKGISS